MSDTAIAVVEKQQEFSVVEVKAQVHKIQTLMRDLMQDGTHYGESFPGDTKKNLLKPGADKLCFMFRLRPDFTQEIKERPNAHMEVLTRCQIFHIESGNKVAEGVGIASTMEAKHRWRNAGRKCPKCGKETIIAGKKEYGGGFICFAKKGGCGAKFTDDDPTINGQAVGKVENTDIADCYNTVLKISKKRAYVDATITACAASDIFSQDADDLEPEHEPPRRNAADLANESYREPRNVTEGEVAPPSKAAAPPQKTLLEQYNETMAEIGKILTSKDKFGNSIFAEKEQGELKSKVKEALSKLKNPEEKFAYAKTVLEDQKAVLRVRLETDLTKAEVPAMYAEPEAAPVEAAADDHFEDDIPWGDDVKPGSLGAGYQEYMQGRKTVQSAEQDIF